MYCAEVKIPTIYKREETVISILEIDVARILSRIRIHVEIVIRMVRQKHTTVVSSFVSVS